MSWSAVPSYTWFVFCARPRCTDRQGLNLPDLITLLRFCPQRHRTWDKPPNSSSLKASDGSRSLLTPAVRVHRSQTITKFRRSDTAIAWYHRLHLWFYWTEYWDLKANYSWAVISTEEKKFKKYMFCFQFFWLAAPHMWRVWTTCGGLMCLWWPNKDIPAMMSHRKPGDIKSFVRGWHDFFYYLIIKKKINHLVIKWCRVGCGLIFH